MQYRINPKNNDKISALGYGGIHFHKDEKEAEKHIRYAIENGVNYFDTAYIYLGSEALLGKILSKDGLRDKIKLATKLPHYLVKKYEDFDKFFNTQLERLKTDRIDYYLMHMLSDLESFKKIVSLGLQKWISEKKASGQIINIGFSFHGIQSEFIKLIDAYDWDFCMIQYNYVDEFNQAGKTGLEYAGEKNIPVIIMEPLRGGTLVRNLPDKALDVWNKAPQKRSLADWGLRWVLNHPQVLCVLSGMGEQKIVEENIKIVSNANPLTITDDEFVLYNKARNFILESTKVPCTGCRYCMPCPLGVDIPICFSCLNDTVTKNKFTTRYWYTIMTIDHNASKCKQCGKCETHCPQSIPIREKIKQVQKELESFPYKPMSFIVKKMLRSKSGDARLF